MIYFQRIGVPICVKKMAAELLMESRRFAEEVDLIKREMNSFLYHYKDVVLPALEAEEEELRKKMKEGYTVLILLFQFCCRFVCCWVMRYASIL